MMRRRDVFRVLAGAVAARAFPRLSRAQMLRAELSRARLAYWGFRTPPKWWSGYMSRVLGSR